MNHEIFETSSEDILSPEFIGKILDRGDVYITIFSHGDSKSLSVYPMSDTETVWKPVPGVKNKVICSACGRESDSAYPYCHWCGEQVGIDVDMMIASVKEREDRQRRAIARLSKFNNPTEVSDDDQ